MSDSKPDFDSYFPEKKPSGNIDIMWYLIKQFQRDQKDVKETLIAMQGTLMVMSSEIKTVTSMHKQQEARLSETEARQLTCTAGTEVRSLTKRVDNLEKHDWEELRNRAEDNTGNVDITREGVKQEIKSVSSTQNKSGSILSGLVTREMLVTIIITLILGTSLGGFLLAQYLDVVPDVTVHTDDTHSKGK